MIFLHFRHYSRGNFNTANFLAAVGIDQIPVDYMARAALVLEVKDPSCIWKSRDSYTVVGSIKELLRLVDQFYLVG